MAVNATHVALLMASFAVFACKEMIGLTATGDPASPRFNFDKGNIPVRSLEVARVCMEGDGVRYIYLWSISRIDEAKAISQVKYGEVPSGFSQDLAPSDLRPNQVFYVDVGGLKTDAVGLFSIVHQDSGLKIANLDENGETLEDWLKENKNRFDVVCY